MTGSGRDGSAGWSAAAKAQEVRRAGRGGPVRRFLAGFGLDPLAGRTAAAEVEAGRWEAGARGEEMTAGLLAPLGAEGWGGFYDRALPAGRANFDHVMVPPCGDLVVLVDSKLWSWHHPVTQVRGELRHGDRDRDRQYAARSLRSVVYETRVLGELLGVRVVPVIAVHSAPVAGGGFTIGDVTVIEAGRLVPLLRSVAGRPDRGAFEVLASLAGAQLPRYVERGRGEGTPRSS